MANRHQSPRYDQPHSRSVAANYGPSRETGDILNGIGSTSSHHSTGSSSISSNSQTAKHNARMSSATPLTSSEDSPLKARSPAVSEVCKTNGSSLMTVAMNHSQASSRNLSPLPPSSPRSRPEARPPRGESKGYRAVWDPELDNKLGKEERRKLKPKLKQFGQEVRLETFIT